MIRTYSCLSISFPHHTNFKAKHHNLDNQTYNPPCARTKLAEQPLAEHQHQSLAPFRDEDGLLSIEMALYTYRYPETAQLNSGSRIFEAGDLVLLRNH